MGLIEKYGTNRESVTLQVACYEKSLAADPNFQLSRNNMAQALTDLGTAIKNDEQDAKAAIKHYKRALTYCPTYADAYYNLGVAYVDEGKIDKAIMHYELAVHFNPQGFEACNNLGVIYKELENMDKALFWYQAALAINGSYFQTLTNLAVLLAIKGGQDEEAIQCCDRAIVSNPAYDEAYNTKGVILRDQGDIREALECYEKCLQVSPEHGNAAHNRLLVLNYLKLPVSFVHHFCRHPLVTLGSFARCRAVRCFVRSTPRLGQVISYFLVFVPTM
eukprot:SAG31_NODE_4793_length_2953_cov_14.309741_4_plen_276_part_00